MKKDMRNYKKEIVNLGVSFFSSKTNDNKG